MIRCPFFSENIEYVAVLCLRQCIFYFVGFILLFFSFFSAVSQNVNGQIFLDNVAPSSQTNPAVYSSCKGYVALPLSVVSISLSMGGLSVSDVVYKKNDLWFTFLYNDVSRLKFYNKLNKFNLLHAASELQLLGAGVQLDKTHYLRFSSSYHLLSYVVLPRDVAGVFLESIPAVNGIKYDFSGLSLSGTSYSDVSVGLSYCASSKLRLGVNFKFLIGHQYLSVRGDKLNLESSPGAWGFSAVGELAAAGRLVVANDVSLSSLNGFYQDFKPLGFGLGCDLGIQYIPIPRVVFGFSIRDIGFINWFRNAIRHSYHSAFNYAGLKTFSDVGGLEALKDVSAGLNLSTLADSIYHASILPNSDHSVRFRSYIPVLVNGSVEFFMVPRLSVGFVESGGVFGSRLDTESTLAINYKPSDLLNVSVSYSFRYGGFRSLGMAAGVKVWTVNFFTAADYVPFAWTNVLAGSTHYYYPSSLSSLNLSFGINLLLDNYIDKYRHVKMRGLHYNTCNCPGLR